MKKIVCIGATTIDIKAKPEQTHLGSTFSGGIVYTSPGGIARNMAENLAKLDYEAYLLTAVGLDMLGELVIQETSKSGVNIDYVIKCPDAPTATYVAMLDARGVAQSEVVDVAVLEHISPSYLEQHNDILHRASYLVVDTNVPKNSLQFIAYLAQENGIPLYVNTSSIPLATKVLPILGKTTLLTTNQHEAEKLLNRRITTPKDARMVALQLLDCGVKEVIITLGAKGVVYCSAVYDCYYEALPATVMETTGAGDALCAAFLARYIAGDSIDESLEYGLVAAALNVENKNTVVPDLSPTLVEQVRANRYGFRKPYHSFFTDGDDEKRCSTLSECDARFQRE